MVSLGPGHIVLDNDPAPQDRGTAPNFRPMSITVKQSLISATAEHLLLNPCTLNIDVLLWSPYGIGQTVIFSSCGFYLLPSVFFPSPNLSGRTVDVYHISTHDVALVRV